MLEIFVSKSNSLPLEADILFTSYRKDQDDGRVIPLLVLQFRESYQIFDQIFESI